MLKVTPGAYSFSITSLIMAAVVIVVVNRIKGGSWIPKIRRIAGLDAIEEAVGRATELGRPVHFSPGVHDITAQTAPQTFAGLQILSYVTKLCARYSTPIICTIMRPAVYPLARETVREAFVNEGKPEMFTEQSVRYLGEHDQAYAYGVYGLMRRERPAANIMMGGFDGTAVGFAENAAAVGCIQVAGTAQLPQLPFFVASCDYTLIGEELYAAGAYLAQDKERLGAIVGQDLVKALAVALLILGTILSTFKMNILSDLLKK
jgi:hypothetical protein